MRKDTAKSNLIMLTAKTFSGLNSNAIKYLLPVWISPFSCVTVRLVFGALAFWLVGIFIRHEPKSSIKDKIYMFLIGAIGIFGYMSLYTVGLSKTTPVSSSIIIALIPIWVFLILLCFHKERLDQMKGIGLFLGLGGACINIFTKKPSHYASDPMLGDMLTVACTILSAIYLIICRIILQRVGVVALTKWSFLGAACASLISTIFIPFDAKVFEEPLHFLPLALLIFILIFPTVGSYILQPMGLKRLKTTVVAMWGYWVIVVATVVALIVGQDEFRWTIPVSIACLCIGIYLVEVSESKLKKDCHEIKHEEKDFDKDIKDDRKNFEKDIHDR